jgi:hypothetical protein
MESFHGPCSSPNGVRQIRCSYEDCDRTFRREDARLVHEAKSSGIEQTATNEEETVWRAVRDGCELVHSISTPRGFFISTKWVSMALEFEVPFCRNIEEHDFVYRSIIYILLYVSVEK